MAKSASLITLDYQRAIRNANSLDKIANDIVKYSDKIDNVGLRCNRDWKGQNASHFSVKVGRVSDNLDQISSQIRNTAETIRRVAKRTYDTEMSNLEIARSRTY